MGHTPPPIQDLLFLLTIPHIGPGRIRKLMQVFENREAIIKAPVQKLVQVEGIDQKLAQLIKRGGDLARTEEQMVLIRERQVSYLTIWDEKYPVLLKRITDPPVILFYKGDPAALVNPSLAVVGTRSPSNYGKVVTADLVRQLVANEFTIVSGLARGVDTIAHHTALQSGGKTVAVLGCGIDQYYPPENRSVFEKITQQGTVLSEYFIGTSPDAINFPKRNRIISGLSLGTLVIEAGSRSGALITALFSLNQNREVFAVPGNINSPQSQGCNRLIKQGAKLVQGLEDILEEINGITPRRTPEPKAVPDNLGPLEKKILDNLGHDPKHIDRLVMELKEAPSIILSDLLTLELMGLVQQLAGKMFIRL